VPPPINKLHADILHQRARLIQHEALFAKLGHRFSKGLYAEWKATLTDPKMIGGSARDYPKALAARRVAILREAKEISTKKINEFEKVLHDRGLDVYKSEYYRHASMLDKHLTKAEKAGLKQQGLPTRASARLAVTFHRVDEGAVRAAFADPLHGLVRSGMVKNLNAQIEKGMRLSLARTIAEGKGVSDLLSRWGGVANVTNRHAVAIARTALMGSSQMATAVLYAQNDDLIREVQWEATFDSRTCPICGAQHGKRWPVNKQPPMPAHLQCRCTLVPVFKSEALNDFDTVPVKDQWGTVSWAKGDNDFEAFLSKQSEAVQRDFFGSRFKHKAWKSGLVDIEALVKPDLSLMTDAELHNVLASISGTPTKDAVANALAKAYPKPTQSAMKASAARRSIVPKAIPPGAANPPAADVAADKAKVAAVDQATVAKVRQQVQKPPVPKAESVTVPKANVPESVVDKAAKLALDDAKPVAKPKPKPAKPKIDPGNLTPVQQQRLSELRSQMEDLVKAREALPVGDPQRIKIQYKIGNLQTTIKKYDPKFSVKPITKKVKAQKALAKGGGPPPAPRPSTAFRQDGDFPKSQADLDAMRKVDGPKGSNPGQWYEDDSGQRWFVKEAKSRDHADNEVAAGVIYEMFGVRTPQTRVLTIDGKAHVVSRFVPDIQTKPESWWRSASKQATAARREAQEDFVLDAWLANWDAVGLNYDNMLVDASGHVWRIDTGGAMKYRARGDKKSSWDLINSVVDDLNNMRSASINPSGHIVFDEITDAEVLKQIDRLLARFDEAAVENRLVAAGVPPHETVRLVHTLNERANALRRYREKIQEAQSKWARLQRLNVEIVSDAAVTLEHRTTEIRQLPSAVRDIRNFHNSERFALQRFTGSDYREMRRLQYEVDFLGRLKESELHSSQKELLDRVRLLDKALVKIEPYTDVSESKPLWRGIAPKTKEDLEKTFKQFIEDGIWELDSVSSASTSAAVAHDFDGHEYGIMIRIVKAKTARPVAPGSLHNHEQELLFRMGTKFRVRKIYQQARVTDDWYSGQERFGEVRDVGAGRRLLVVEVEEI